MDLTAALPIFVITLREGFEAALVVGIVLACLKKAEQTQLNPWVYRGISAGIVASVMVGFLLGGVLQGVETAQSPYTPVLKATLGGLFGLIAIIMLSWMLIWMTKQAKSLKAEVEGEIQSALANSENAEKVVFLLVFIAVLREGFETVLFVLAKFQEGWTVPTIGAIAGLLTATVLGFLLFAVGVKINLKLFFQVMGVFLLLIIGGLVMSVLKDGDLAVHLLGELDPRYQSLCIFSGDSCLLGNQVWDGSQILPDRTFPGILLKALFGYRQTLYLVQIIVHILFLGIMGTVYFRSFQSFTPTQASVSAKLKKVN